LSLVTLWASTYQFGKGGFIIFIAFFSKILLGRKFDLHHYLGLFLTFTGLMVALLFIYSADAFNLDYDEYGPQDVLMGAMFLTCAMTTNGMYYVSEEKIF